MTNKDETLADDLLRGAEDIGFFIYGSRDPGTRRKVYALDREAYGLFYMGKLICGLKSTIRRRIAAQAGEGAQS